MPNVLITGGGGLVGLNTARAFAADGKSVVITARRGHDQIQRALGDLRDLVTIEPVELARGGEVFDLFSRYHFEAVVHGAQAHQSGSTPPSWDGGFGSVMSDDCSGFGRG